MTKPGRNAPCPCGSGLKYKRCCEEKDLVAEAEESLGTFDAHEQAEMMVFENVYNGTLVGVWTAFHGLDAPPPSIEAMEDFYLKVYGYELDETLIQEIVFPLSRPARTSLRRII